MILHIDTRGGSAAKDRKAVTVSLKQEGKILKSLNKKNEFGSQVLLPLIDRLLKTKNLKYENLDGIEVEVGPGSFTGLRVGISVANALGFSLRIPVNGKKIETELRY